MSVSELKLKAPIVHANPVYLKPLAQNPKADKLRAYHAMCDKWNQVMDPHPSNKCWTIQKIVDMSNKTDKDGKKSVFYKAQFNNGDRAWFSMDTLRVADPFTVINHAYTHGYYEKPGFEWIQEYLEAEADMEQLLKIFNAKAGSTAKYKFGVEVPPSWKHALELDRKNGTTGWKDSIKLELDQLTDYRVFKVVPDGEPLPPGYKRIPYHIVFDVKFDGRLKSRLVAGGHRTDHVPKEESYSGVVSMEAMRLGFMLGKLNGLTACPGDVGNVFLHGTTRELVYIIAGP